MQFNINFNDIHLYFIMHAFLQILLILIYCHENSSGIIILIYKLLIYIKLRVFSIMQILISANIFKLD